MTSLVKRLRDDANRWSDWNGVTMPAVARLQREAADALEKYAGHSFYCAVTNAPMDGDEPKCDCGLYDVLDRAAVNVGVD